MPAISLKSETNSDDMADMLSTIIEGGIIVSRALNDPAILMKQLLEYRNYVGVTLSVVLQLVWRMLISFYAPRRV